MSNTFWFVVPVYFDVESFSILRSRLLEVLGDSRLHSDWPAHFVVVDDSAGRDAEIARLAELSDTSVLTPRFNLGHQLALVYGLRKMSASMRDDDIVVTLDADGEDRPEDLPNLLAPVLEGGADDMAIALARRTHRQESPLFKLWYFFFRILFRALTGTSVRTGNYVAYHGCVARRTLFHPSFDLCYSSTFLSLDLTRRFVSCPRGSRYAGSSGMNTGRLATHGLRMLMPFLDRIATRALAFLVALFTLGLLSSAAIVAVRIFTDAAVPGWATYTLLSLGILSFLALGNFVVLFAVFSQSRVISLTSTENGQ